MRYRQANQRFDNGDQQAKSLIKSDDILSTQEQEAVIAYFARSLRSSTQFLKVVVCLHAVLALVYTMLLMSGSLLLDLSVDASAAASLQLLAQQQQQQQQARTAGATPDPAAPTPDPLEALAALEVEQRAAQRRFVRDYMERRSGGATATTAGGRALFYFPACVMLYSVGLLLWTAWSGYQACRQLRVNIDDLTSTEPRDLPGRRRAGGPDTTAAAAAAGGAGESSSGQQPGQPSPRTLRALRQRIKGDPVAAQYAAAALAALASLFWVAALLHRQHATTQAYAAVGLEAPSVLSSRGVTAAMLEYVLAVWQPLFHGGIGLLLRSMLDTRENLVALSKLKYRFDKV